MDQATTKPKRRLLVGAVGLVKGRVKDIGPVLSELCKELEPALEATGWFESAPFQTIHLMVRLGPETDLSTELRPVIKKYAELPAAIYLSMEEARVASRAGELKDLLRRTVLVAIFAAARKYGFPVDALTASYPEASHIN